MCQEFFYEKHNMLLIEIFETQKKVKSEKLKKFKSVKIQKRKNSIVSLKFEILNGILSVNRLCDIRFSFH